MSAMPTKPKRGPTVLVTDAREMPQQQRRAPAPPTSPQNRTKLISVDNILQYASEIPSGQRRGPPEQRPKYHNRTPSGRAPLDPKLSGRLMPAHLPARSSKVSEKLVLLPEAEEMGEEEVGLDEEDEAPPKDEVLERRKSGLPLGLKEKSYAERLPKARRTEKLARVTAYCTAQSFKLKPTAEFLKTQHHARTKLYDDCLYAVYHLRLLPGTDGYRVKSAPVVKSPGGKSVLDEEIERNEQGIGREGYFGEDGDEDHELRAREMSPTSSHDDATSDYSRRSSSPRRVPPDALSFGEMFIFSYGVVVFWNFTDMQEKDILADTTFSEQDTGISLVSRPQPEEDFEMEEFHFEYNPQIPRPRMFNDMITLKSGDHMIKLAISHAIAQSTKLCFFEERMSNTMLEAQHVPRRLALTGKLGMDREEVVKILGRLFTSRVEVNLSSNVLDVPNFFWESEPTLHALYFAVREYLEIKPRIQVLNERCKVFLDLAEILSDSIADKKMTRITWIIIVLIILSIIVTCSEVIIRFGILAGSKGGKTATGLPSPGGGSMPDLL